MTDKQAQIANELDEMRIGQTVSFIDHEVERITAHVYRIDDERELLTFVEVYDRLKG